MSGDKILVPLLEGFEEIEAVTIIDVLRRAELPVVTASDRAGPVRGSHGIEVSADVALADVELADLRAVVLPGGMPGSANLAKHERVQSLLVGAQAAGKHTCAICAAPMALAAAGVHQGKRYTCYPGFNQGIEGGTFSEDRVVVDGTVITSRGPGTALEFALTLVRELRGEQVEKQLESRMLVNRTESARYA